MNFPTFDLNVLAIKAFAIALLASLLVFGGCRWQGRIDAGEIQKATARADTLKAAVDNLADLTAKASAKAKDASNKVKAATTAADKRYQEKLHEAKQSGDDLAAALRTGDKRLRDLWACRATPSGTGGTAADGGQADGQRRNDSAGRIAGAVKADAAAMDYLWSRWEADRKAVISAGCAVEASP